VIYRFGPYTLDPSAYRLTRDREIIQLSPKIIDLLLYLVARQPALVSKDDLFKALWPDVAVTDNALTQAVSELRQALHDDPAKPAYIQTVARRGYRFIAPVTGAQTSPATMPALAPTEVVRESAALPVIAVLDFTNVTGDRELGWLASGIAETVTNDLRAIAPMRVVDRLRVVEAVRRSGGELSSIRADLHLDLAVVGSFQRAGNRLRITARVVDAATGEATAEAKADGALEQVFELQDRIVGQFADVLWAGGRQVRTVADTSSLEAYRSYTEGRVKLESLDASFVPAAIDDFERAIGLDPRYAAAHVGLANARFWQYEASRPKNQPEASLLARAIDHVRKAIEIERDLAEAHATLSFLLMSAGRAGEALVSARRAVGLEPRYWGNQFRLAHAAWGEERLQALARTIDLYQDFPFVHFEMAMVHIARGHLDRAEPVLREGTVVQDRQADRRQRFPAKGLHWLLGLVRLACGDEVEAQQEFALELASGQSQLYAREFAMNAHDGAGFASMKSGNLAGAIEQFTSALALFPAHARSLIGLATARAAAGDAAGAESSFAAATAAIDDLRRGGRHSEAALAEAMLRAVRGDVAAAITSLTTLLERPDLPFSGWTIPIEPLLAPVRQHADYEGVRAKLAERAR
jgi:DNA-binding winged helix-turn-helix (wHTH) protein/tetratricopeptide (TPR) repeat protein